MKKFFWFTFLISSSLFAELTPQMAKEFARMEAYCKKHPNSWESAYNLGCLHYQDENYQKAEELFTEALKLCKQPELQEPVFYNLGNTYFKQAEPLEFEQKIQALEKCIQNYESALSWRKDAQDTQHNLKVAKKLLEDLKKKQEQNKQDQNKNQDRKDQDKHQDQQDKNGQNNQDKDTQEQDNPDKNKNDQGNNKQRQDKNSQQDPNKSENKPKNQQQNQQQQHQNASASKQQQQGNSQKNPEQLQEAEAQQQSSGIQQEMQNILQKAKNDEKILPMYFQNGNGTIPHDKVLKDW